MVQKDSAFSFQFVGVMNQDEGSSYKVLFLSISLSHSFSLILFLCLYFLAKTNLIYQLFWIPPYSPSFSPLRSHIFYKEIIIICIHTVLMIFKSLSYTLSNLFQIRKTIPLQGIKSNFSSSFQIQNLKYRVFK